MASDGAARQDTEVTPAAHLATVYENRGTDRYDPYVIDAGKFLVGCTCGWYSGQVESRQAAFETAQSHTKNVRPEVESLFPEG
jgi:hypothetical protein